MSAMTVEGSKPGQGLSHGSEFGFLAIRMLFERRNPLTQCFDTFTQLCVIRYDTA